MGHSNIAMTYDLYGHLFTDEDADTRRAERAERLAKRAARLTRLPFCLGKMLPFSPSSGNALGVFQSFKRAFVRRRSMSSGSLSSIFVISLSA